MPLPPPPRCRARPLTLKARGLAVLVLHHPAKKDPGPSPSGRGSGALLGGADILAELRWYRRVGEEDRRRLVALSRFEETPRQRVIEWNAAGPAYLAHGSFAEADFAGSWQVLRDVLRPAERKLTRAQILGLCRTRSRPRRRHCTAGCGGRWRRGCCARTARARGANRSATGCRRPRRAGARIRWPGWRCRSCSTRRGLGLRPRVVVPFGVLVPGIIGQPRETVPLPDPEVA